MVRADLAAGRPPRRDQGSAQRMNSRFRPPSRLLPALAAGAACLALAAPAGAQTTQGYYSSNPNVTVDLSVLGGPGNAPVETQPLPADASRGDGQGYDYVRTPDGLLFPPASPPRSRLDGRYATRTVPAVTPRPTRVPASSASAPQSRLTVAAPVPSPTPMPAPAPAKAPPPAPTAATPPPAATPAPVPSTTSSTRTAAVTPVPPAAPAPPPVPAAPAAPATAAATTSAAASKPEPGAASTATPTAVETASRSSAPAPDASQSALPDTMVRVLFEPISQKLPDDAKAELLGLVGKLEADDTLRLQIEAYAAGTTDTASKARRLSLSRALAVRSYLIEQGVRSTRMDVHALGNKASDPPAPADRVDARLVAR
jgi:outer membrane protein OmpA-like peptidoglycan-associated protein